MWPIYLGNRMVATVTLPAKGLPELNFVISDHLGYPEMVIDTSGTPTWTADHLPFGEVYSETGPDNDPGLRYPGQWTVPEAEGLGLPEMFYNGFRWYRAGWGRYLEADPIGLRGGVNLFGYANGNSLRFVDPLGLQDLGPADCVESTYREYLGTDYEKLSSRNLWKFVRSWTVTIGELETGRCFCQFKLTGTIDTFQDVEKWRTEIICLPCFHGGWIYDFVYGEPYELPGQVLGHPIRTVPSMNIGGSCACEEIWNLLP